MAPARRTGPAAHRGHPRPGGDARDPGDFAGWCAVPCLADRLAGVVEQARWMNAQTAPQTPGDDHTNGCRPDPVRAGCPVECLAFVLSAKAFNPLHRAYLASCGPPRTVGDVALPCQRGLLPEIRGLGPRRIGEIEMCLVLAGLVTGQPTGHRHQL